MRQMLFKSTSILLLAVLLLTGCTETKYVNQTIISTQTVVSEHTVTHNNTTTITLLSTQTLISTRVVASNNTVTVIKTETVQNYVTTTSSTIKSTVTIDVIEVTAEKLSEEYDFNEVRANSIYKNQKVNVIGEVYSIYDNPSGPWIRLSADSGSIICVFDNTEESVLAVSQIQEGQWVTIQGICIGYDWDGLLKRVFVKDCIIVSY